MKPTTANVLSVYERATADHVREGLSWYLDAHKVAKRLSRHKISRGAGVIAALSPMMEWEQNKRAAEIAFAEGTAMGLGLDGNCVKATRILHGENPLDVLGGDKVRAFYQTILDPSTFAIPVIDRHAFDIAIGKVTDDAAKKVLKRKGVYQEFGNVYVLAAKRAGIGAPQMQAITWVAWRDFKKGK